MTVPASSVALDNDSQPVLEAITCHFVHSKDFNGILASQLAEQVALSQPTFIAVLERLLTNEEIAIAFNHYQGNPHILRFPSPDTQRQLELLKSEPLNEFGLYPTAKVLIHREDLAAFTDRPFIKGSPLGRLSSHRSFSSFRLLNHTTEIPVTFFITPIWAVAFQSETKLVVPQMSTIATKSFCRHLGLLTTDTVTVLS